MDPKMDPKSHPNRPKYAFHAGNTRVSAQKHRVLPGKMAPKSAKMAYTKSAIDYADSPAFYRVKWASVCDYTVFSRVNRESGEIPERFPETFTTLWCADSPAFYRVKWTSK